MYIETDYVTKEGTFHPCWIGGIFPLGKNSRWYNVYLFPQQVKEGLSEKTLAKHIKPYRLHESSLAGKELNHDMAYTVEVRRTARGVWTDLYPDIEADLDDDDDDDDIEDIFV